MDGDTGVAALGMCLRAEAGVRLSAWVEVRVHRLIPTAGIKNE